jgi:hypothetical protein
MAVVTMRSRDEVRRDDADGIGLVVDHQHAPAPSLPPDGIVEATHTLK